MAFTANLNRRMRELGLKQADLQRKTGITAGYLSKLMRGARSAPGAEALTKLAAALDCSIDDLLSTETPAASEALSAARAQLAEADDPYPNRALALEMVADLIDDKTRRTLLRRTLPGDADLSVDQWVAEAKALFRKIRQIERDWHLDDDGQWQPADPAHPPALLPPRGMEAVRANVARQLAAKPAKGRGR